MPFQRPADCENVRMRSADFRLTANESLDFNRNFNRNFLITISLRALDDRLVAETAPYPGIIYLAGSDLDSVRAPALAGWMGISIQTTSNRQIPLVASDAEFICLLE